MPLAHHFHHFPPRCHHRWQKCRRWELSPNILSCPLTPTSAIKQNTICGQPDQHLINSLFLDMKMILESQFSILNYISFKLNLMTLRSNWTHKLFFLNWIFCIKSRKMAKFLWNILRVLSQMFFLLVGWSLKLSKASNREHSSTCLILWMIGQSPTHCSTIVREWLARKNILPLTFRHLSGFWFET